MGLSASQARLLALTSRQHDLEYKAQNLEAQKLQMSNESDKVYEEYEDALNATKVQMKQIGADGSSNYVDITSSALGNTYAYEVATGSNVGKLYDSSHLQDAATAANNGTAVTINNNNFATALTNLLTAGYVVLVKVPTTFTVVNGTSTIDQLTTAGGAETNIATDTNFQEVSDDKMLKKAEAKYEASMNKINQKDKKFDTDLASLDTERNAIKTEQDTLKTVAKDNVDRTFKLFS